MDKNLIPFCLLFYANKRAVTPKCEPPPSLAFVMLYL